MDQSLVLIFTVVAVFGAVALGVGLLTSRVLAQNSPERRRLRQAAVGPSTGVLMDAPTLTEEDSDWVKQINALVPRSPKTLSSLRRRFARAGMYDTKSIAIYTLAQLLCPAVLAISIFFLRLPATQTWLFAAIAGLVGYQIPSLWLMVRTSKRQKQIQNGLADLLDLLIVCLEAGSGLDQALVKSSDELALAYPALAEEIRIMISEVRAGKPRLDAFRSLASRTGVDDVRSMVAMLVQTDRFGTSVSQALRTHAEVVRTKRRQRAEEKAAKMGVKLVFPLVFMLFPAFFVVTLGPSVIKFIKVFSGAGAAMGQ
jgi:tight adherence protein C